MEQVVYIPFGQWDQMLAYRSDRLEGIVPNTGLVVLWNITQQVAILVPSPHAPSAWGERLS